MNIEEIINKREATRSFSNNIPSDDVITKLIDISRKAPSAKNNEPTHIYVVKSNEGLSKIDEATPCRYNAPIVLIITSNKDIAFNNQGHSTYEIDGSILATHIMLTSTSLGLDNIWIDLFDRNIIKEKFNISEEPICLIPIGYKSESCPPSPNHNKRKTIEEIVTYI